MSVDYWSLPSALWLGFWLLWPLVDRWLRPKIVKRSEKVGEWYVELAPWLFGLLPAYGAWLLGLVPGRQLGFMGRGGVFGWLLIGLILLALWFGYRRYLLPRANFGPPVFRPDHTLLDEPRWALYRGAAWFWLGNVWWGMLMGFVLMLIEWALLHQVWRREQRQEKLVCFDLARRATSSLAFTLSANLWLTMVFQAGLLWPLIERGQLEDSPG